MTPRPGRAYRLLAVEAVRDGVRRRIVPVIVAISLLSLLAIDSCTSCASGGITVNGKIVDVATAAGWGGALMFVVLALWTMVLAGVLASDHVAQSLDDGSATLTLARPVGRTAYALARLSGSLAIALAAGAVLLSATALLLHLRAGVPLGPAVWGLAACAAGAVCVGAFAAAASLVLPQIATALLVLVAVGWIASVNLLARLGAELQGVHAAVDRLGPPLASALVAAIAPWIDAPEAPGQALEVGLRLLAWAGAGLAALVVAFRRAELGR
jgi:hypothetical protein